MGDQIGESLDGNLYFVPQRTFERVRRLALSHEQRTSLFADLCRINTLYMVARAGSGHLGSSFSSLDLVSWFCIDDHYLAGGQGQMLCSALAESGLGWVRAQRFGVAGLPACGCPNDVLRHHGLDVDSLVSRMRQRMSEPLFEIRNEIAIREPPHTIVLRQVRSGL